MEKRKRWHFWLIVGVLALTIYNILPTIFFYAKPLDEPVGQKTADRVVEQVISRVDRMEGQSIDWLTAYSKNLSVKPTEITPVEGDPKLIRVSFKDEADAKAFRRFLPEAGARIPFAPAQLTAGPEIEENEVIVQRRVGNGLSKEFFAFGTENSPEYRAVVHDRLFELATAASESETAKLVAAGQGVDVARQIVEYKRAFGEKSVVSKRFFAHLNGGSVVTLLEQTQQQLSEKEDSVYRRQGELVEEALAVVEGNRSLFSGSVEPLGAVAADRIVIGDRNPFVESVFVDWDEGQIQLALHADVQDLLDADAVGEENAYQQQLLIDQIAFIGRAADEKLVPAGRDYAARLNKLSGAESFLILDLEKVGEQVVGAIRGRLETVWHPTHPDLRRENFPIWDPATYESLPDAERQLGLVVGVTPEGSREGSLYVIARGMSHIAEKSGRDDTALYDEFRELQTLMAQDGFIGYPAAAYGLPEAYANDWVFELPDYYSELLMATREKFSVYGTKRFAVLDFSTEKQRLLVTNEIETREHEDLLKWRDEYQSAQVSMQAGERYLVPPPTRNVLWDNFKLSTRKYFRGDERKVLNWGLDLSGGKSVAIGLRDMNNHPVTDPADIKQGINELTGRVNKMGVSEVEIRQEGDHITLNFPGAQALSASELVKASTMSFHIVNETYSRNNPALSSTVKRFLQEVWNQAVVSGHTDAESLNRIAYEQMGGLDEEVKLRPRSEAAQTLWEKGLRIANPDVGQKSGAYDESLSAIARMRGDSFSEWQGQSNPLMIVFHNYALEGVNLENVSGQYDPSKGNKLVFGIKSGARNEFYAWTSQFAEDRIGGTPKEAMTSGKGWRMAIILNGSVVNAPRLIQPLKNSGEVTGNFSQREINQLVADLKAGSLSFTPKILSEKNVSPDLGQAERTQGIVAAAVGLALVILAMTFYYRLAGIVAGCAVLFNLLIMWGVLQNLDAALTLPGIAGIILTIGMAVDANVLVFERVREEFAISGRIASAVQTGYKKAFSAIVDSNVTTIIAALILLHFDAGPIKGFAVTLIIGILSSMFTALFMTRYFFSGWVQNPKHKALKMVNWFKDTNFNFLSKTRLAVMAALAITIAGGALFYMQRHTIFGMDFTGGYALNVTVEEQADVDYAKEATVALSDAGAEVQIRALNKPNQLRIQLGMGMEQAGRPFYGMPQEVSKDGMVYAFETNPRIDWVVGTLTSAGLTIKPDTLAQLNSHWNAISGQFSDTMRNSAIWGLTLALVSILIYITFRFEFKYAISSIIALTHDLCVTIGLMAILHQFGVPVQLDLQVIGALMTIIGYSLNDTIVIFDRIREDARIYRKLSFSELINRALNTTLNRTLITSGTTLLVLLALVSFGGMAIFGFALVMTMGVIIGTFSSIFIASSALLYFHNREITGQEEAARV